MTTVVLVRHGETDWNRDARVQGWAATPLNDRGREQARAVGRHLAEYDFDRLVASDLRRTRETTALLREGGTYPEPEFSRRWRERSFGEFQGLSYDRVFGEFPEHRASFGMVGLESAPEGGESLLAARERVLGGWTDLLAAAEPDDAVLVVTHGGPLYVLLGHVRGVDLPTAIDGYEQDNCAINEVRHDPATGETAIVRENDVSYREELA